MIPELGIVIQTERGPHVELSIEGGDAVAYRIKSLETGEVSRGFCPVDKLRNGFWLPVGITAPQVVAMSYYTIRLTDGWFESDEAIPYVDWVARGEETESGEVEDSPDTIDRSTLSDSVPTFSEPESDTDQEPGEETPGEAGDSLSDLADMSDEIIAELRAVLQTVRTHGPMRATDVVTAMGWPRSACSQGRMVTRLTTLQREGLVIGEVSRERGPGRKPIMWRAVA